MPSTRKTNRKKNGYLHGYTKKEQNRLYKQAKFLEPQVFRFVDYKKSKNLVEVGSGVGAQTKILLKRFPQLKITGVDASHLQLQSAEKYLHKYIKSGKVELSLQNAEKMSFVNGKFDSAFLCWLLEHVPSPLKILNEVKRILKPGSVIYCSEIQNASLFVEPYSPTILKYWFLYNDHQWLLKGDPFVGAKLGNLLKESGFKKIEVSIRPLFFDSRNKKTRNQFLKYWTELMLSGAPALLKSRKINQQTVRNLKKELAALKKAKDSVFFFTWVQAKAVR